MKFKRATLSTRDRRITIRACSLVFFAFATLPSPGQTAQSAVRISLDEAIHMAIEHNHNLKAARSTILQGEALEVTANLRPNPTMTVDWEYLPLFATSAQNSAYLHDSTEGDVGLSYLFERGHKRQRRLQAAKDQTAITRSQVVDTERGLTYQVATLFTNAQLAESTLGLALEDLKSFQNSVELGEAQFKSGALSENDYLKLKLQLLQFESDVEQERLARVTALSDLRALLGFESVASNYDVEESFDYQPMAVRLEDLQLKALQNRPDLRAAVQGVTAANSQYLLQKSIGKQDVTGEVNYSHVNAINAATFLVSVPLPFFNRNQGEIARTRYAITQSEEQRLAANEQVLTDVQDAYEGLQFNNHVVQLYRSGYLDISQKSRDISEYAYHRGATSLLDFLDAERTYRATQLAYRQSLASYLLAVEQLREAVGIRVLP